ncbi:CNNM transmembrane domain-containing protein [Mycena kentingensis (nom. inval.)]|nr:CNNM transmembrane domain-containing protein [Mycena kentingensis (nom. inval.)]
MSPVPTVSHPSTRRLLYSLFSVAAQYVPRIVRLATGHTAPDAASSALVKRAQFDPHSSADIAFAVLIPVLVLSSGLFAGLTLGYMSLDETQLNVLRNNANTPNKIKPIRKNGHLLLVTLLLANMITNETLPIVADPILGGGVNPWSSRPFAEIIPQSICTRHGLYLGAKMAGFTKFLIYLLGIFAWPVAKILELALGPHHGIIYRRAELKELIAMHSSLATHGGDLKTDTVTIIGATLDLQEKVVRQAMTPIADVFMLSIDANLDYDLLKQICLTGHSRVPVYEEIELNGSRVKKILGILLVKQCVLLDPKDAIPLRKIPLNKVPFIPNNEPLLGLLDKFQEGRSHMAIVSRFSMEKARRVFALLGLLTYRAVGVLSVPLSASTKSSERTLAMLTIAESLLALPATSSLVLIEPPPTRLFSVAAQYVPRIVRLATGHTAPDAASSALVKRAQFDPHSSADIAFAVLIPVLVLSSGLFAGLTLGYMSLDETQLNVLSISGTPKQREYANKIKPIRKNGHLLLVTLLLANMITNETLPIVADPILGGGVQSVVVSTVLIVIFAEIIPQSVCTRHGLYLGAKMAGFTKFLIYLLGIFAWPVAKILELALGPHHGIIYRRAELKELIAMHSSLATHGGDLKTDTVTIIGATLDLQEKVVRQAMTPIADVFMLSIDANLDYDLLKQICLTGHSRVPVYEEIELNGSRVKKILGILLVKQCVLLDPKDAIPLRKIPLNKVPFIPNNEPLLGLLDKFQEGRSHMAIVSRFSMEKARRVFCSSWSTNVYIQAAASSMQSSAGSRSALASVGMGDSDSSDEEEKEKEKTEKRRLGMGMKKKMRRVVSSLARNSLLFPCREVPRRKRLGYFDVFGSVNTSATLSDTPADSKQVLQPAIKTSAPCRARAGRTVQISASLGSIRTVLAPISSNFQPFPTWSAAATRQTSQISISAPGICDASYLSTIWNASDVVVSPSQLDSEPAEPALKLHVCTVHASPLWIRTHIPRLRPGLWASSVAVPAPGHGPADRTSMPSILNLRNPVSLEGNHADSHTSKSKYA